MIVSIHDVSPMRLPEVSAILQELDRLGVKQRVLKVIPCEAGVGHSQWDDMADLLRREQAAGSEIVLHGFSHRTDGPLRGPLQEVIRGRLFAPQDAEFLSIDEAEARRRLEAGRERLTAEGLRLTGFCAPGWLAAPWLAAFLQELGFQRYIGMSVVRDLGSGRSCWLPWLGQIGAGRKQEALVRFGGGLLGTLGRNLPVIKVFLHPVRPNNIDLKRMLDVVGRMAASRQPTTYAELVV